MSKIFLRKNNRKGQVFVISVVIAVTLALTSAYFLLHFLFEPKTEGEYLGSYQSGIIDALSDGDKAELYIDQAAKMAVSSALEEYLYGDPNIEGGEDSSENTNNYCGSYIYKLWNSQTKDCYPEFSNSNTFELNPLITTYLTDINFLAQKEKKPLYLDGVLKQSINYEYKYDATSEFTNIYGNTNDNYRIEIFKDGATKTNPDVNRYLQTKATYSGEFMWPLPNHYSIASCFGYRGQVSAIANANHGGLDISSPINEPVIAAAPGTVEQILYPAWGKVVINHGGGLRTGYIHMNNIAEGLRVGDTVEQGQIIGYVGGRGANSASDYPLHLHFEVTSTTVNSNVAYKDVSGIVIGKTGTKYVNPICFLKNTIDNPSGTTDLKINFDMQSKACNSVCDSSGRCAIVKPNEIPGGTPYKFCSEYEGIVTKEVPCPKSDKAEWKIDSVELSSAQLTSDQTLEIKFSVINTGVDCVTIYTKPKMIIGSHDYTIDTKKGTNVYKTADKKTPTALNSLTCTFSSDEQTITKAIAEGRCVLLAPTDDKTMNYIIQSKALFTDYNGKSQDYTGPELRFTVKKGAAQTQNIINTTANTVSTTTSTIKLTDDELARIAKTKESLTNMKLYDYIATVAKDNQVPPEIIYGLITDESNGDLNADSGLANGIMQVTEKTYNDPSFTFPGKCSWKQYLSDKECQIRAGIIYLKKMHDQVQGKTLYYQCNVNCWGTSIQNGIAVEGFWSSCTNGCSQTKCIGPVNKQYTDWEAALRRYNGGGSFTPPANGGQTSGCVNQPDYAYVEKVMRFSQGWGYAGTTSAIVKEEASQGIYGTYDIKPSFTVKLNFDMRLFDVLQQFSKDSITKCGVEGEDKKACLQKQIDAFNTKLLPEYKNHGVNLSMDCDSTDSKVKAVNNFIEQINDCMQSTDNACNCAFVDVTNENIESIRSSEASTIFTYSSNSGSKEVYLGYDMIKDNKSYQDKRVNTDDIQLYKDNDGRLIVGTIIANNCNSVKNQFRFCLDTNYQYTVRTDTTNNKIVTKDVRIPFALLIRDQTAPSIVTGFDSYNLEHAKNMVVLRWNKNKEIDILKYNLYLADDNSVFERPVDIIKQKITPISVSSDARNYEEYKSIDLDHPVCKLQTLSDTNTNFVNNNANSVQYCIFEYNAVTKDDKNIQTILKPDQPYYISNIKKFIYILNGSGLDVGLTVGKEKLIAITAVDIDGNEIDNQKDGQKIESGKNLITIKSEDKLEAGLTKITTAQLTTQNKLLTVSWNEVKNYIDGTPINSYNGIKYLLLISQMGACPEGLYPFNYLSGGKTFQFTSSSGNYVDVSGLAQGNYCIGVSTSIGEGIGYKDVFLKGFNMPNTQTPP